MENSKALVLIPNETAIIQNLGPFLTGRLMETDILKGSALIASEDEFQKAKSDRSTVRFAFEGNANRAVNLERFHERCACAAGRLSQNAPSIAYGEALTDDLFIVASYDIQRFVFLNVIDDDLIEKWSGERLSSVIPPSMDLPCHDLSKLRDLFSLPMTSVISCPNELLMWKLLDGNFLIASGTDPMVLRSKDDPEFIALIDQHEIDEVKRSQIYGSEIQENNGDTPSL